MRWRTIKEFPDYAISSTGKMLRVGTASNGTIVGRILKPYTDRGGYLSFDFRQNGKRCFALIHRLVLIAFGSKPVKGKEANHLNGIKADNRIENLEWVSRSENLKHAFRIGLMNNEGGNNPRAKLKKADIYKIRELSFKGKSGISIAKIFNVSPAQITKIKLCQSWAHI